MAYLSSYYSAMYTYVLKPLEQMQHQTKSDQMYLELEWNKFR